MGERKLFRLSESGVQEIESRPARLETYLQATFERNLESLLGIRFLATQYITGADHRGRIDTLGLDENGCPVIIEYKRHTNENILSQVLFYLDWLLKSKSEFELLVLKKLGQEAFNQISWDGVRLLCIAADYAKYDLHAVNHIDKNIELLTYRHYGKDLLLLDYITGLVPALRSRTAPADVRSESTVDQAEPTAALVPTRATTDSHESQTMEYRLARADEQMMRLFDAVCDRITSLGEDVQLAKMKQYYAFKRIKNFVCAEIYPTKGRVTLFLKIDPKTVRLEPGFTRDVTHIGHFGTGDLEVFVTSDQDLDRATALLEKAYSGG